jgi:hypothetical protein
VYASSIAESFINAATALGIRILSIQTFPQTGGSNQSDGLVRYAIEMTRLSGARVILLPMIYSDLQVYFRLAMELGFVGAPLNYLFTDGGTTTASSSSMFLSTDPNFTAALLKYTTGWIGTSPTVPSGPLWDNFVDQWLSVDPAEYPGIHAHILILVVESLGDRVCVCLFWRLPVFICISTFGMDYC